MKKIFSKIGFSLVAASLFLVVACESEPENVVPELSIDKHSEVLTAPDSGSITVAVTTNATTEVSSDRSWCVVESSTTKGGDFKINIGLNTGRFERAATVTFKNGDIEEQLKVEQPKGIYTPGMKYEIPIVFHTVYNNQSNESQYVAASKIYEIFDTVSNLYEQYSDDLGIKFVLAEEDEAGETLPESGIHRLERAISTLKCLDVMNDPFGKYTDLCWDPRKYLNVTIYKFGDQFAIVGLSRPPYLVDPYEMEGVEQLKEYEHPDDLGFVYTISLNNSYLYPEESEAYNMYDFGTTLAHEIGHYLGLFHPYSETYDSTGAYNSCDDTDFCVDTPSYNRYLYEEDMFYVNQFYIFTDEDIETLSYRTACVDDSRFRSTNIMDYAIGDSDEFTAEQRQRMRYVLENSPYIPGAKSTDFEELQPAPRKVIADIPVRTIECRSILHRHK